MKPPTFEYYEPANSGYLNLVGGKIQTTIKIKRIAEFPNVALVGDLDADGNLIGLEIIWK